MPEDWSKIGVIQWIDLTVEDAERMRDFYKGVVGWEPLPVAMNGYDDYNMNSPVTNEPAAGVCHARGSNAPLPPQWLIYVPVKDIEASCAAVERLGGKIWRRRSKGQVIIEDPA